MDRAPRCHRHCGSCNAVSAFNFSLNEEMKSAFQHLGLPNWFRIELTVAKILGTLALLIHALPNRIKEFAYFGFALTLISAVIAHSSSGDGISSIDPLLLLGVLIISICISTSLRIGKICITSVRRQEQTLDRVQRLR